MGTFLIAAAGTFALCWVWVGGYVADLVIWIISKFVSDNTNEANLAIGIGVATTVLGIVLGIMTGGDAGAGVAGIITGIGVYVAVRLPNKVRRKRYNKAAQTQQPSQES